MKSAVCVSARLQLQVITEEHLQHLVSMATDEPDSAAEVDRMLIELDQFHRQSAVSSLRLVSDSI